jgi:abortive infection bacteriophage resistance protein
LPGASFQNAVDLYVFDKKLRLLALDAIERIEIAMRVDISHLLGKQDRFAYLKPDHFHESFSEKLGRNGVTSHHGWLSKHAALINRSKEDFITHNRERYGLPLPIWVACEVWDFGTLSTLYAGMKENDQDIISAQYGITNGRTFATWLRSLNYLRNVSAHHSRLWNRNIIDQPKLPPKEQAPFIEWFQDEPRLRSRPYLLFLIANHIIDVINPTSSWRRRLNELLLEFPNLHHIGINLNSFGVDPNWQSRF